MLEQKQKRRGIDRRVRVAMIVGDRETLHCGVKDHAHRLGQALRRIGFQVDIMAPASWNVLKAPSFLRSLQDKRYDILHIQYPSIGFRTSLIPHLIGLLRISPATVVTLHEFTLLPAIQRLSVHAFRWTTKALFFGSTFERSRFNRLLGSSGATQEIFPILSQVPSAIQSTDRDLTVAYFGQIRPNKGLEAFLELARLSEEQQRPFRFHIMGSVNRSNQKFALALQSSAHPGVRWSFDLTFERVAQTLVHSFAAYLPFPDGASDRRGSMPAAWLNGLPVLSTAGEATTDGIRGRVLIVSDPKEALQALDKLRTQPAEWERLSRASCEYAKDHSWDVVANQHAARYLKLLRSTPSESR